MTEKTPHLVFRLIKSPADALGCSAPEKMVLLCYVECLNAERNGTLAWPGLETIAEQTGYNERTVRRAIDRLCELDLIKLHRRTPTQKIYTVNVGLIHRMIETGQKVRSPAPVSGQRVQSRVDRESTHEWTESPLNLLVEPPTEPPTGNPSFAVPPDSEIPAPDPLQRRLALHQVIGGAVASMRMTHEEPRTEEKREGGQTDDRSEVAAVARQARQRPG